MSADAPAEEGREQSPLLAAERNPLEQIERREELNEEQTQNVLLKFWQWPLLTPSTADDLSGEICQARWKSETGPYSRVALLLNGIGTGAS